MNRDSIGKNETSFPVESSYIQANQNHTTPSFYSQAGTLAQQAKVWYHRGLRPRTCSLLYPYAVTYAKCLLSSKRRKLDKKVANRVAFSG